jgi:benzil reductase ((S)-benzoin forming)
MRHFLITGVSRGIGEAIARKLLQQGHTIFCASRTMNEDLVETASALNIPFYYLEADLSDPRNCERFVREAFSRISPENTQSIVLINNAGMLEPIARIEDASAEQMEQHLKLNLLAPSIISSLFIGLSAEYSIPKVILNISSGAALFSYAGWSMYCTSKAGLDMLTRTIGLEQNTATYPVKIFSLAPGIVNTSMQSLIRQADSKDFSEKDKFVKLHEEGKLSDPADVATIIARTVLNPDIAQGANLSIEDLKKFLTA